MRPTDRRGALAALLWGVLLLLPALAAAAPRIGVITMEPGEVFFERFGHNALLVQDDAGGEGTSYNFGYFNMDEPDFFGNFVRGDMQYWLVALPVREDLARYAQTGRGVTVQWLDLDPAQARALADALAENALPENAQYRYDYYTDNCSTRVRDAIDLAIGGALEPQLAGRSQGNTYRSESVRLAAPAAWMAVGFHLGLGGYADRPLSRWEESFIPMRLRDALREAKRADGRPLVASEETWLPHRIGLPPDDAPRPRTAAFFAGLALAGLALWTARRAPRALAAGAMMFWLVAGLAGTVMALIWLATAHVAGHGNQNLLLFSPLCLFLLPGGWALLRGREPSRRFRGLLLAVAGSAAVAGFLKFLPFVVQENVEWVLLLLPLHWALLRGLAPKR